MSQAITIDVPDAIAERYPTWDDLRHSIYESMVISEFQKGFLTMRESAQLLGLTYEEFIDWLGERKLTFINATPQELEESYHDFETFMQSCQEPHS